MSDYNIKTYQEEFLEAQEKVGKEATKEWKFYGQTPAVMLKQIYSRPDFDPETRHYAFKGEELVGFLTSKVLPENEKEKVKRASLELPITLPEHQECEEALFEKAVETLKQKGIQKVQARVGEPWKGTKEKAQKWGFKFSQELYVVKEAQIKSIERETIDTSEVQEYDHERDFSEMVHIFVEHFGQEEKQAKENFENIHKNTEQFPLQLVIRREDKIVARLLAQKSSSDPKKITLGTIVATEKKLIKPLIAKAAEKLEGKGFESMSIFLWGELLQMKKPFKALGFKEVGKIDLFEKEISK